MKRKKGVGQTTTLAGLLLMMFGITLLNPASSHAADYYTIAPGSWNMPQTWASGTPSYNGTLENGSRIYVDHDVTLVNESFSSGAKKFELHVGKNQPATLVIDKNFTISSTISIIVYEGSAFITGKEPADPDYNYCDSLAPENALFQVGGSEQDPSLTIRNNAKFILYGDLEVQNRFNIDVATGGSFKVYGSFTAGNTATVSLTGTGAAVGCDMLFDNGASIFMEMGTLTVGGDLLFGNTANLYLNGSTVRVGGSICSYPGGGAGATVYLQGTEEPVSTITSLHTCEDVTIVKTGSVVLPISLLSFTHQISSGNIILEWETASEINNDYFVIERSQEMNHWEAIGSLPGAGTSNNLLIYRFVDQMPREGTSYYRLKQTDHNGRFVYFDPLAVNYQPEKELQYFRVTRSPGQWMVHLPEDETWQVEIHALTGRILHHAKVSNTFSFSAPREPVVIRVYNNVNPPRSQVVM